MSELAPAPVAVVGIGAIMPDAPDAARFWANIRAGRYSISDVPPGRWDPDRWYDPDRRAPGRTYSRIGGWVREFGWDPARWGLDVPAGLAARMDDGQRWAVAAVRAALRDAGWPGWTVDPDRVAVIIGSTLPPNPHEVAARVARLFAFRGPNFTTDAACASGLAALSAAVHGLRAHEYDLAVCGGVEHDMSVQVFVRLCEAGALSGTGSRPFDARADGMVIGEGCAVFVLRRLRDAELAGDRVYAVLRGFGGSGDGPGDGSTGGTAARSALGQRLAIQSAWANAGLDPARAGCIEAHGASTRLGDATELAALTEVFGSAGAPRASIALGSVTSNVGHLGAAAGTAGLAKLVMSLYEKVLPATLNVDRPNPDVDWDRVPFTINTRLGEWPAPPDGAARCGGVSAFGSGGTNFHAVVEEYRPGRHRDQGAARGRVIAEEYPGGGGPVRPWTPPSARTEPPVPASVPPPLRGALPPGARASIRSAGSDGRGG